MNKNKKNKTKRLPQDIRKQLIISLQDLINDAKLYDSGNFHSINRSANTLRLLFHQTNQSVSLLSQLELGKKLRLVDYSNFYPDDYEIFMSSVFTARFNKNILTTDDYYNTFLFYPNDSNTGLLLFKEWWNGTVYKLGDTIFTRKSIVLISANQNGGSHFDPNLDTSFLNLIIGKTGFQMITTQLNSIAMGPGVNEGESIYFYDIHLAYLRQIVHETILTFLRTFDLNLEYYPDFDYNFNRKLNQLSGSIKAIKN